MPLKEKEESVESFTYIGIASCRKFLSLPHSLAIILRGCLYGGRKILAPGKSYKADRPSPTCFLYLVYMQRVVLVLSARIFLAL